MTTSRFLAAAAALAAVIALGTACSSSSGGAPAQPPAPASGHTTSAGGGSGSTAPKAAPTSAVATGAKLDVCAALPAPTVAQLTGTKVTKAEGRPGPQAASISISTCNYTGGMDQLDITVARSSLAAHLFADDYSANKQVLSKTAMVSGIGDKAFTASFPSMWLEVLWGDEQLEISGASSVSVTVAEKVLTTLHDKV